MTRLLRFLLILLCFEIGVLLVFVPWSPFWERNYFLHRYPDLVPLAQNNFVRGAISGLGFLDILIAAGALLGPAPKRSASRT